MARAGQSGGSATSTNEPFVGAESATLARSGQSTLCEFDAEQTLLACFRRLEVALRFFGWPVGVQTLAQAGIATGVEGILLTHRTLGVEIKTAILPGGLDFEAACLERSKPCTCLGARIATAMCRWMERRSPYDATG